MPVAAAKFEPRYVYLLAAVAHGHHVCHVANLVGVAV